MVSILTILYTYINIYRINMLKNYNFYNYYFNISYLIYFILNIKFIVNFKNFN